MITVKSSISKVLLIISLFLLVVLIVGSCTAKPATELPNIAPTSTPVPKQTITALPEPTSIPSTSTPVPKPTMAAGPEFQATGPSDIIGGWVLELPHDVTGTANFEFKPDGTYSIIGISGPAEGATIDSGTFLFENEQLKLETTGGCLHPITTERINPCIGLYAVFVAKQGDQPVYIKFSVIDEDASDRKKALNNHKLLSADL